MTENRNFGLDLARAIAIISVVLAHYFKFLAPLGFVGVDLFFALSGFLIGRILLKTIEVNNGMNFSSLSNFLKRRWFRTAPNYFLFLLINYCLFNFFNHQNYLPENIFKYFFFLQDFLSKKEVFFGESWSLCVEEFFYFALPVTYFLSRKLTKTWIKNPIKLFMIVSTFYILAPLFLRQILATGYTEERFVTIYRLDSIMYGVVFAYFKIYYSKIWKYAGHLFAVGIFGILALMINMYLKINLSGPLYVQIYSIGPLFMALGIPYFDSLKINSCQNKWFKSSVTNISIWSYSLYLIHLPIIFVLKQFSWFTNSNVATVFGIRVFGIAVSIYLSKLLFNYFEVPFTALRERKI